jgi:hypothetical protein
MAEPRAVRAAAAGETSSLTSPASRSGGGGAHPIAIAGLLVGFLDICAAFALNGARGVGPAVVLQAIASGLLGPASFGGGGATAALGLLLHFLIAFGAATVFYLLSRRWTLLLKRAIAAGIVYGVLVYGVMDQIVLPLSRVQLRAQPWSYTGTIIVIHVLFVGLPISLTMARMREGPPRERPSVEVVSG